MRVLVQEKLDGASIRLTYVDGKLAAMVTRGNGQVGDDITVHAQHLKGLPQEIADKGTVHVRGEAVMYEADFTTHFASQKNLDGSSRYKNARNTVVGLLKGRSSPEDLRYIHFVAYEYHGPKREELRYESSMVMALQFAGFETPQYFSVFDSPEGVEQFYHQYDRGDRDTLPYKTDGLVIKVDDIQLHGHLPGSSGRPGHAVAIKPTSKVAVTTVREVKWVMGLSGRFTPVAQVEPVELDGVTVRQINMFNLAFLNTWVNGGHLSTAKGEKDVSGGFGLGAVVTVERTGDVLPYLLSVITPASQI